MKNQVVHFDSFYSVAPSGVNINITQPFSRNYPISNTIIANKKIKSIGLISVEWNNFFPNIRSGINDTLIVSLSSTTYTISLGTLYVADITTLITAINLAIIGIIPSGLLFTLNQPTTGNTNLLYWSYQNIITTNRTFGFTNTLLMQNILGFYSDSSLSNATKYATSYYNLFIDNYIHFNINNYRTDFNAHEKPCTFKLPLNVSTGDAFYYTSIGFPQLINWDDYNSGVKLTYLNISLTDRFGNNIIGLLPFDFSFSLLFEYSDN